MSELGTAALSGKASVTGASARPIPDDLRKQVAASAAAYRGKPGALLSVLEETQSLDPHRHLSEDALRAIAEAMDEPLSRVYSVATFYSYYSLVPQGQHVIVVCRGTACHTRGSLGLLQETLAMLGAEDFREDEEASFTTADRKFTVRTVACFGQCALAPVVSLDGVILSRLTPSKLKAVIERVARGGKR